MGAIDRNVIKSEDLKALVLANHQERIKPALENAHEAIKEAFIQEAMRFVERKHWASTLTLPVQLTPR